MVASASRLKRQRGAPPTCFAFATLGPVPVGQLPGVKGAEEDGVTDEARRAALLAPTLSSLPRAHPHRVSNTATPAGKPTPGRTRGLLGTGGLTLVGRATSAPGRPRTGATAGQGPLGLPASWEGRATAHGTTPWLRTARRPKSETGSDLLLLEALRVITGTKATVEESCAR